MAVANIMRIRQVFTWLIFCALACWGTMAIIYSNFPTVMRIAAAAAFLILISCAAILPRSNRRKIIGVLSVFALVLAWWLFLPASNDRNWQPDVATLPSAVISGDSVAIRNIRNCDYTTENVYVVRHYDRTFDLKALRSMDLFLIDWGLPHIAHTMLSFGFAGDKYVCFSIETRKKIGEEYSSVKGFFKQYELTYVVADERDVVRLRANYRKKEDVYLYRLKVSPELMRMIFLDYLRGVNRLKDDPQWYNALTANCTTDIWKHIVPYYPKAKVDWRLFASGHVDEMVYGMGVFDQTLPFQELRRRSLINERSKAFGSSPAFSKLIRHGLPGFE